MSYFNHAFRKVFFAISNGAYATAGKRTDELLVDAGKGAVAMVDQANQWKTVALTTAAATAAAGKPLTLVGTSLAAKDKIGAFHGGYQATNKSKYINPKYVTDFYRVDPAAPAAASLVMTASPNCMLCNETYDIRLQLGGSPVRRFLGRDAYKVYSYNSGCCADPAVPTAIDPMLALISYAEQINEDPELGPFLRVQVSDGTTTFEADTANAFSTYATPGSYDPAADARVMTLTLTGAYVNDVTGVCSWEPQDFFDAQPVDILGECYSYSGDSCETCCFTFQANGADGNHAFGTQGRIYGNEVAKEFLLSESYRQNDYSSTARMREVLGQNDMLTDIDLSGATRYYAYHITHVVPRTNNPSSVFDNDKYELVIYAAAPLTTLEAFLNQWLSDSSNVVQMRLEK